MITAEEFAKMLAQLKRALTNEKELPQRLVEAILKEAADAYLRDRQPLFEPSKSPNPFLRTGSTKIKALAEPAPLMDNVKKRRAAIKNIHRVAPPISVETRPPKSQPDKGGLMFSSTKYQCPNCKKSNSKKGKCIHCGTTIL